MWACENTAVNKSAWRRFPSPRRLVVLSLMQCLRSLHRSLSNKYIQIPIRSYLFLSVWMGDNGTALHHIWQSVLCPPPLLDPLTLHMPWNKWPLNPLLAFWAVRDTTDYLEHFKLNVLCMQLLGSFVAPAGRISYKVVNDPPIFSARQ